jgi:hypothetical protein
MVQLYRDCVCVKSWPIHRDQLCQMANPELHVSERRICTRPKGHEGFHCTCILPDQHKTGIWGPVDLPALRQDIMDTVAQAVNIPFKNSNPSLPIQPNKEK